jgi:hypothetical protein
VPCRRNEGDVLPRWLSVTSCNPTHNGGQATTDKAETRRLRGNGLADFPTRQDRRLSLSVPRTLASAGASEMPYHRRPGVGPWSSQGVLVLSFTRGLVLLPRRCAALQSKTATLAGQWDAGAESRRRCEAARWALDADHYTDEQNLSTSIDIIVPVS